MVVSPNGNCDSSRNKHVFRFSVRRDVCVVHQSSKTLAVALRCECLAFNFLAARSPHTKHSKCDIPAFRKLLRRVCGQVKKDAPTILMIDVDGSVGSVSCDSIGSWRAESETYIGSLFR